MPHLEHASNPAPELGLRIAELPKKTRTRAEKLAAFIRDEFRALNVPVGDASKDAAVLKRLANDPSVSDERLEALEKATGALVQILQGKDVPLELPDQLSLTAFEELLDGEGLTDTLPNLRTQIAALAEDHEKTYGYSFRSEEILIPKEAFPRMLLGLKEGILVRPLVVASPTADDIARLKLKPDMTMLEHRIRALAASGMEFTNMPEMIETWKQLRAPEGVPLWTACAQPDGTMDASIESLKRIYVSLPPPDTLRSRAGTPPKFFLIGPDDEPSENRFLADGVDGQPTIVTHTSRYRTAKGALEAKCRLLSPEAALLALGTARDGVTSKFSRTNWGWLGGIVPNGCVAGMRATPVSVRLRWFVPSYGDVDYCVPVSA